jgi:flagellar hook-associated protein 1
VSDLFTALHFATRSLEAQRFALDVTGHNIANVNTPGYSRRAVDFSAVPPDNQRDAGRGVEVAGIRAQRDRLTERRLGQETSGAEREAAIADLLGLAEVALGTDGQGIDKRLNEFFDSFAELADAPTSAVARQQVVLQGNAVAAAFRDASGRLSALQRDADRRVVTTVDEINAIADRLAVINEALTGMPENGSALQLQDEQATLISQLSALTDVTVIERGEGGLDVDLAGGRALVVGTTSVDLTAVASGANGRVEVRSAGVAITSDITGGRLGGVLRARDVHIPDYIEQLDAQAYEFANAVNAIHSAGFGLNGTTNQNLFAFNTPPVGSAGAAAALIVDPAVAADINRVAAAEVALPGDNRTARALADLRNDPILDGGTATFADKWGQLVFTVGRDVQTATSETALRKQIVLQLETLRDQVSGVSLDEEAMNLVKFQRAYEANARFFQVIDETLEALMATVGR